MKQLPLSVLVVILVACGPKPPPLPGGLKAGVATVPLNVPLGIALGGFGRNKTPADPGSPFAEKLPASRGIQSLPTARGVALSDELTTTVVVRIETALTTSSLRFRAQTILHDRGVDATLLLAATHTHAGPARFFRPVKIDGSAGVDTAALAMDVFLVEEEERVATSIADAAQAAIADLRPASVGVATAELGDFNNDRRCENDDLYGPDYKDPQMVVIRLDEVDASGQPVKPITAFLNYAMHGTVLGASNMIMSTDAPGAMELYASDLVGVPLVYVQGSTGDVSPRAGGVHLADFQALEHLGRTAAPLIADAFGRAAPQARPPHARLQRYEIPIDLTRAALGYAQGEFAEFGGIECGLGADNCPPVPSTKKDLVCLPLARRAYSQTSMVALRLEDVLIVSMPGEPTTAIGARVKALGANLDVTHTMVLGYAQDHFGYILEEPDYLRMGYEPSVSPWGWRMGDFLMGKGAEAVAALGKPNPSLLQPPVISLETYAPINSTRAAAQVDVVASVERLKVATFRFAGGDPALGTPTLALERQESGAWVPVMASPTRAVTGGPELMLREDARPTFVANPSATERDFVWTVEWETLPQTALGNYRLVAKGRIKVADALSEYTVTTAPLQVTASHDITGGSASIDASGALNVVARFPPNPSLRDQNSEVVGNYRLRALEADPWLGAPVENATATATVAYPDASSESVTLTWVNGALKGTVKAMAGTTRITFAAGALVDGSGNSNGSPLVMEAKR